MKSAEHEHNAFLEDTELDKQPVADSKELEPEPQQCAAGSKSVLVPVEGNKVLEPEPRQRLVQDSKELALVRRRPVVDSRVQERRQPVLDSREQERECSKLVLVRGGNS